MNPSSKKLSMAALLFFYLCIAHKEAVSGQQSPYEIFLGTWKGSGTNSFGFSRTGELSITSNGDNRVKLSMVTTTSGRNFSNQGDGVVDGRIIRFSLGEAPNCSATLVDDRTLNFECQGHGSVRMTMQKDRAISETSDERPTSLRQTPNDKESIKQSFAGPSDQAPPSRNHLNNATATTTRNQSGSAVSTPSQRCGNRIDTGNSRWGAWRLISESPLSVLPADIDESTAPVDESRWEMDLLRNLNYTINNDAEESERRGAQKIKDWLLCLSGRGTTQSQVGSRTTQSQLNVGNASEAVGRIEGGKRAWKRGDSQPPLHEQANVSAQSNNNSPPRPKYVSKDATHCVEIVPQGFKCDGPYDRFLTNICMTKISVRWRLGSDGWGQQELVPKGCTPVSPFRDQRGVQFKACSWDPKANYAPYWDPCRY